MPQLLVVPDDIMTMMRNEDIPLSVLSSVERMANELSAHDMAEIQLAHRDFPFAFDHALDIQVPVNPLSGLADHPDLSDVFYRVEERKQTLLLKAQADDNHFTPVYLLNPVDETLWVAVQQRQGSPESDPQQATLKANRAFFDALMAQALHLHPFERVCRTNLFTHYLNALV